MNREELFDQVREAAGGAELLGEPAEQADEVFDAPEPEQNEESANDVPVVETEAVAPEGEFVYDDGEIRRTFNSELELKSFESGVKSNEIGRLRKMVEELKTAQSEQPAPEQPRQSREEYLSNLIEIAWPDTTAEQRQAPELQRIAEGMDRLLGAFKEQVMEPSLQRVSGDVEKMRALTAEEKALASYGVTAQEANEYLQKHPGLKALEPAERVAVVADALKGSRPAQQAPKDPLNAALANDPANYVEPSARNTPSGGNEALETRLKGKDPKEIRKLFGEFFEDSGLGGDMTF
jgi:hypothetical protein